MGKRRLFCCFFLWMLAAMLLGGCSFKKEDHDKVRDLEFTVVGEADIPQELKQIIAEKQEASFKLTYSNDQNLFIVVGYGKQASGGYSIGVNQLYLTSNSIVFNTELLGPKKGEQVGTDPSYPYIVVRTENLENPVIFK